MDIFLKNTDPLWIDKAKIQRDRAVARFGNKGTRTVGMKDKKLAGMLGEEVFYHTYGNIRFKRYNTFHYDYVDLETGLKIECKAQYGNGLSEKTNFYLYDSYEEKNYDILWFCYFLNDLSNYYIIGFIKKFDFIKNADRIIKGQIGYHGRPWKYNGYHLDYKTFKLLRM
jgi:hypothetical protein